jgi:hypothetical protein
MMKPKTILALAFLGIGTPIAQGAENERDLDFLTKYVVESTIPRVRAQCARDIEKLGPSAKPASRALCRALLDRSKLVRDAAGGALEKVNPDIYWPTRALLDADRSNHIKAAAALSKLGQAGSPATPVLLHHLQAMMQECEILAVKSRLAELAGQAKKDQAAFHEKDELEQILAKLLAQAVNRLDAPGEAEDRQYLQESRQALLPIVPADMQALAIVAGNEGSVVKAIARGLQCEEVGFRLAAVDALANIARMFPDRRKAIMPEFMIALRNKSSAVRLASIKALDAFGSEVGPAIPRLRKMQANDHDVNVRHAAADFLKDIED